MPLISSFFVDMAAAATWSTFDMIIPVSFFDVLFFDMRDFEISSRVGLEKAVFSNFFQIDMKSAF
jgi:hypothetical protein